MAHDQTRSLRPTSRFAWKTSLDLAPPRGCDGDTGAPSGGALAVAGLELAVEVDEPAGASPSARRAAFEIWTRNRVYHLDAALVCLAVTSRDAGPPDPGPPDASPRCRGARLVGARRRVGDHLEIWRPLPVAGSVAIFSSAGGPSAEPVVTSPVERVVIRQGVTRVPLESTSP